MSNDEEIIEGMAAEVERKHALSAIPQRQLILTNDDRMTIHGLITASLGAQGMTVTPAEFDYFVRVSELRGLNPLFRETHFIKDRDGRITVQVGIDGFRKLAEDTGQYKGQTAVDWGPMYEGDVPAWQGKPGYCRVGVYREGFVEPLYGEAWLEEDGQLDRDGVPIGQWGKRPRTMLKKVAEARGHRAAFPRSLAGLYTDDELQTEPRNVTPALAEGPDTRTQLPAEASVDLSPAAPSSAPAAPADGNPSPAPPQAPPVRTTGPTAAAKPAEGTWSPPEPPAGPDGLQGPVEKAPDGLRQTRVGSEIGKRHGIEGQHDKLEVVIKVARRRHTAMLFDGLADAVDRLELAEGELVVIVGGSVEEIEWQEGKPKKKEIWGVSGLSVMRGGEWRSVTAGESSPAAPAPTPDPPGSTAAASPSPASSTPSGPTPADVADETVEQRLIELTEVTFNRTNGGTGRAYAKLVGADVQTGELILSVMGDDPPGELAAEVGTPENPTYRAGVRVIVFGTWRKGWLILTAVSPPAGTEPFPDEPPI